MMPRTHAVLIVAILMLPLSVMAGAPRAQFDVTRLVACRDVTTREFADLNPGEKLIEAPVQVSLLVYRGRAEQLVECLYRFESPASTTQVVDYLPKTTMESRVAGNIKVEDQKDGTKQIDLSVGGDIDHLASATVSTTRIQTLHSAVHYELLPPREMLAAAGTTGRGTGVYFKLRRSPQLSLEGSRDFVLVMRVPRSWRGDYLRVTCQSASQDADSSRIDVTSSGSFLVPLYLAGDGLAKSRANDVFESERQLFALANSRRRDIQRRSQPTWVHELSLMGPKIPATWLSQLVHAESDTRHRFERYLPADVRQAVNDYRLAKRQLRALGRNVVLNTAAAAVPDTSSLAVDGQWTARQSPSSPVASATGG